MKTLRTIVFLVVLVSNLAFAMASSPQERPFSGVIFGEFLTSPTSDPEIVDSQVCAEGLGTHVGAFSKITSDQLNVLTGAVVGSFEMTTANGDLVTGTYSGFVIPDFVTGDFDWVLDATITGGTGRFSGATGTFVFEASGNFVVLGVGVMEGEYVETFHGTITY